MNTRAVFKTILIWLALTIAFAAIGIDVLNWPEAQALATRGVEVQGKVVSKDPENHKFIQYTYVVREATYLGGGSAGRGNPEFEQLKIGDRVKVYYDPDSPKESVLGNAQEHANSITTGVLFIAIVGPLGSILALYQRGWLPISKRGRT